MNDLAKVQPALAETTRSAERRLDLLEFGPVTEAGETEGALQRAVRAELLTLLEQSLNYGNLLRIARLAQSATTLLASSTSGVATGSTYGQVGQVVGGSGIIMGEYGLPYVNPSSNSENIGTTMMRELMATLAELLKSRSPAAEPTDSAYTMTLAIQNAKNLGLHDVADALSGKLRSLVAVTDREITSTQEDA